MSLPQIEAKKIVEVARRLHIVNHETGSRTLWVPNYEQETSWGAAEQSDVMIFKPRAIGISTAFDLADLLHAWTWDHLGHRVRVGVCLDTDDKAKERCKQIRDFAWQLGLSVQGNDHTIKLPHGTEIVCFSAGGERPAASTQFQRIRFSEYAFYGADALAAIGPSISLSARTVIETTCSPTGKNFVPSKNLWRKKNDGMARVFFPVEAHAEYRMPEQTITDDEWQKMKDEGYTSREAAAWFLRDAVDKKLKGDERRAFGEFPQLERHMFQSAAGVVINVAPRVVEPVDFLEVNGVGGDLWKASIYRKPDDTSGQCVMAVDTSQAKGLSRSAIVMVDKRDGQIAAAFWSAYVKHDDLARVAQALQEHYRPRRLRFKGFPMRAPLALIEDNGIGHATCTEADRLGLSYEPVNATADSIEAVILNAKRAIESGTIEGPDELADECDNLVRDEGGAYLGRKDLIICLGMALGRRKLDGYVSPDNEKDREERVEFARALEEYQRGQTGGIKRPKWGV